MADSTARHGDHRKAPPSVLDAALELLERQLGAGIARARELHGRRVRIVEVLIAGGSMHQLAREFGVSKQTIRNDVDLLAREGIRVPVRGRTPRTNVDQGKLPVA